MTKFNFEVQKVDGYARKGLIKTKRGDIDTPASYANRYTRCNKIYTN